MRWRAWLADGSSVSSTNSDWGDVPMHHVVVLKLWPDEGPKAMYHGHDAIWWDGTGEIYQLDLPPNLHGWARREGFEGRLKFGKQLPNADYERIYAEALAAKE
jgi:hypothetical protein